MFYFINILKALNLSLMKSLRGAGQQRDPRVYHPRRLPRRRCLHHRGERRRVGDDGARGLRPRGLHSHGPHGRSQLFNVAFQRWFSLIFKWISSGFLFKILWSLKKFQWNFIKIRLQKSFGSRLSLAGEVVNSRPASAVKKPLPAALPSLVGESQSYLA